jgi:hypothetical protein
LIVFTDALLAFGALVVVVFVAGSGGESTVPPPPPPLSELLLLLSATTAEMEALKLRFWRLLPERALSGCCTGVA